MSAEEIEQTAYAVRLLCNTTGCEPHEVMELLSGSVLSEEEVGEILLEALKLK